MRFLLVIWITMTGLQVLNAQPDSTEVRHYRTEFGIMASSCSTEMNKDWHPAVGYKLGISVWIPVCRSRRLIFPCRIIVR